MFGKKRKTITEGTRVVITNPNSVSLNESKTVTAIYTVEQAKGIGRGHQVVTGTFRNGKRIEYKPLSDKSKVYELDNATTQLWRREEFRVTG